MKPLYHYCSTKTFASIVSNRSVWLSSLSLSNDALEGKLVSKTVDRILEKDNIKGEIAERIKESIVLTEKTIDALGLCLSEEDDLLSQWRGYATDAQGFSIGFSRDYLNEWVRIREEKRSGLNLYQVKYKEDEHEAVIRPVYDEIKKLVDSGNLDRPPLSGTAALLDIDLEKRLADYKAAHTTLVFTAFKTFASMFILKNNAFREELEWRLVSYALYSIQDDYLVRSVDNKLIPYREYKFKDLNTPIITDVVLGPKNITPTDVVSDFLNKHGFEDVNVRRSIATYR